MRDSDHIDTRILRTYDLLTDAFLKISRTKSVETIRISEVCDSAMVHRATFYNHFNDKDDFINFVIASSIKKIQEATLKEISEDASKRYSDTLMLNLIDFAEKNRNLILDTTAVSGNDNYIHKSLHDFFLNELGNVMVPNIRSVKNRQEYESAFCHFIAGGSISLIRWWLSGGYEFTSKEELVDRIRTAYRGLLSVDQ